MQCASTGVLPGPVAAAITSGPSGITADSTLTFEFGTDSGSSGAGIRFQCKLADSSGNLTAPAHKDWQECTSPASFPDLPDGSYQFAVRADVSGRQAQLASVLPLPLLPAMVSSISNAH